MQHHQGRNLGDDHLSRADIIAIAGVISGTVIGVAGLVVFFCIKPSPCFTIDRKHQKSDPEIGIAKPDAVNMPLEDLAEQNNQLLHVGDHLFPKACDVSTQTAGGDAHGDDCSTRAEGEEEIPLGHESVTARAAIIAAIADFDQAMEGRANDTLVLGSIDNHLTATTFQVMEMGATDASQSGGSCAATGFSDQAPSAPTLSALGSDAEADPKPLYPWYSG